MTTLRKVPVFALVLALAACGGDAESAGDLDSEALEEQIQEQVEEQIEAEAPPAQTPPTQAPPAQTPPTGQQQAPPPPVQDSPPVQQDPVEDPVEEVWEEVEEPINLLPVGTMIPARMDSEISTRTHAAGDEFRATVSEDLRGADGMVLVPAGAEVIGRVTTSQASSERDEGATLVLSFEALMVDGMALPIRATVIDAEVRGDAADSRTRSAATVATGAAAGAVLGQILGRDTRSTVAGAAVGAVAGAGIAMTTRDGHAVVPAGSTLRLQLDEPLVAGGVR
jgi:hypothetical protein